MQRSGSSATGETPAEHARSPGTCLVLGRAACTPIRAHNPFTNPSIAQPAVDIVLRKKQPTHTLHNQQSGEERNQEQLACSAPSLTSNKAATTLEEHPRNLLASCVLLIVPVYGPLLLTRDKSNLLPRYLHSTEVRLKPDRHCPGQDSIFCGLCTSLPSVMAVVCHTWLPAH